MSRKISEYYVGEKVSTKKVATISEIEHLAEITGDYNPIHLDLKYAKTTIFGRRIAHGMFCHGMISMLIGNKLPGEGAVFIDEYLQYLSPVYEDDEIEATVEIIEIDAKKKKIKVAFTCRANGNRWVLQGESLLKLV